MKVHGILKEQSANKDRHRYMKRSLMSTNRFQKANQLVRSGRLEEAIAIYYELIQENPNFYCYHQNLANTLLKQGKTEEAKERFNQARSLRNSQYNFQKQIPRKQHLSENTNTNTLLDSGEDNNFTKQKISSHKTSSEITKTRPSIQIVLPSFNRNQILKHFLYKVNEEAKEFDVSVDIFDDGSKEPVVENADQYPNLVSLGIHRYNNHGKQKYWQLVTHIFQYLKYCNSDIYMYLADDLGLVDGFFQKAINYWNAINDPNKVSLTLGVDHREKCWTNFKRVKYTFGAYEVYQTQWLDMMMLFNRKLLEALDYQIYPISPRRWKKDPKVSSGVGRQISLRLHEAGYSLYQVTESLISHGQHPSMMNPEARKISPLYIGEIGEENKKKQLVVNPKETDQQNKEEIVASLATIPSRSGSLEKTINSLYSQVDRINVYLNNYKKIPKFLLQEKIHVVQSQVYGDIGDSGKFWWCDKVEGYHFICDDDLTYPEDYIEKMISKIEHYERKAIVGLHGSFFRQPFLRYHPSQRKGKKRASSKKTLHLLHSLQEDTFVQMLATSSLTYHTSTIQVTKDDFEHVNMADVWFSLIAQKQGVPRVCIQKSEGWVKQNDIDVQNTIYSTSSPKRSYFSLSTRQVQDYVIKNTQPWKTHYLKTKPVIVFCSIVSDQNLEQVRNLLESWQTTRSKNYHWVLIVAVKNSDNEILGYLHSINTYWQFTLLQHSQNDSHAEQFNSILNYCYQFDFDYAFYAEPDITFTSAGWEQLYINAIQKSGYSYFVHHNLATATRVVDNVEFSTSQISDFQNPSKDIPFFTFTKRAVDLVGFADTLVFTGQNKNWKFDLALRYCRAGFNKATEFLSIKDSSNYIHFQDTSNYTNDNDIETNEAERAIHNIVYNQARIHVAFKPGQPIRQESNNHIEGINDFFDQIYVLNAPEQNSWENLVNTANKYELSITQFPLKDGKDPICNDAWEEYIASNLVELPANVLPIQTPSEFYFDYEYDVARIAYVEQQTGKKALPTSKSWGYLLSLINLLEDAILQNYKRILILEDNVLSEETSEPSINSLFVHGIKQLPEDWKILLLGAHQYFWEGYITTYSENLYQSNGTSHGSFALAIQYPAFVPLLHHAKKFDLPFDIGALHKVQRKYSHQCFSFQPNLFTQKVENFHGNTWGKADLF